MDVVTAAIGLAGSVHMFRLLTCMRGNDTGDALALVGQLHESSKDMERLCTELTDFFRQLMICKTVREPSSLLALPPNELAHLQAEAATLTLPTILHAIDILQRAKERMHTGADRRVEMEMAVIKLCSPELDADVSALTRRIKVLEDMVKGGYVPTAPAAEAPAAEPAEQPVEQPPVPEEEAPEAPAEQAPPASDEPVPFMRWSEVLEALSSRSMPLFSVLSGSTASIAGDRILVTTDSPFVRGMLSQDNNASLLLSAVRSVTGRSYRLGLKAPSAEDSKPANETETAGPLSDFLRRSREQGMPVDYTE